MLSIIAAAVLALAIAATPVIATAAGKATAPAAQSGAVKPGTIRARAAIVANLGTGEILFAQNADARIAPASLAKLMTLLLLFEAVDAGQASLEDTIVIGANAARLGGSRMGLRKGEQIRLEELAKGLAIASGNDAAVAVAEQLAGGEQAFVRRMNARARELGLRNTRFKNPHGLHAPGMYTTARDMLALCAYYLETHPEALGYHKEKYYTHRGARSHSANPLLGTFAGADGLKTGYVGASGYNLAATAKRGDTRLVAVVLGARSAGARRRESARLLEAMFAAVDPKLARPNVAPSTPELAAGSGQRDEDLVAAGLQQAVAPASVAKQYGSRRWWNKIRSLLQDSDELWRFCAPAGTTACRTGYAIIRRGELLFAAYADGK